MNTAPTPPNMAAAKEAAGLEQQILATEGHIEQLEEAAVRSEAEALQSEAEAQQAAEAALFADMRRREAGAHAAALGVNTVVHINQALRTRGRPLSTTAATTYDVRHPQGTRQQANYAELIEHEGPDGTMVQQGRRPFWREGRRAADQAWLGAPTIRDKQHENMRAEALGMGHHFEYPGQAGDRALRRARDFFTRGPQRVRHVDPHEKQIESDETVRVSDALALSAHRIGQEVDHAISRSPALPDRVRYRRARGRLDPRLTPGDSHFTDMYELADAEVSREDVQNALEAEEVRTGRQLHDGEIAAHIKKRLSAEDSALTKTGQHVHQLAFGEQNQEAQAELRREAARNHAEIERLSDATFSRPGPETDKGINFLPYEDTLTRADGQTLRNLADLRQNIRTLHTQLGEPNLTPAQRAAITDQIALAERHYTHLNGAELTSLQAYLAPIDRGAVQTEVERAAGESKRLRALLDRYNTDEAAGRPVDQAARTTAQADLTRQQQSLQQGQHTLDLFDNMRMVQSRRNEIVELDNRNHQIAIILDGGVDHQPRPVPSAANRGDVLDYFTDTARRQIDVVGAKAAFDTYTPRPDQDVLAQDTRSVQELITEGMQLFPGGKGPDYDRRLESFLGSDAYEKLPVGGNGARTAAIKRAVQERMALLRHEQDSHTAQIRQEAVQKDILLDEERVVLPALMRALSADPEVTRGDVTRQRQEEARQQRRQEAALAAAQAQREQAEAARQQAEDTRRELARLRAERAANPTPTA